MTEPPHHPSPFEKAKEAVRFLKKDLPESLQNPRVAIVCGSGLGGLADTVHGTLRAEYEYSAIPHFPCPTGKMSIKDYKYIWRDVFLSL